MEKELLNSDKELLLKDLCARLPYGVKCEHFNRIYGKNVFKVTDIRDNGYICGTINNKHCWAVFDPLELKPYLFPLSSITEEQKEEYNQSRLKDLRMLNSVLMERISDENNFDRLVVAHNEIDWLNKNHFDYRGLIPMGLANDATGLNIY